MWTASNTLLKGSVSIILLFGCGIGWAAQTQVTLENQYLSVAISTQEKQVHTRYIENRRTGRRLHLQGDDFVLEFEDGSKIAASTLTLTKTSRTIKGGRQRITFALQGNGLRVQHVTELESEQWWATRWLEIKGAPKKLTRLHLARWQCTGAKGPAEAGTTVRTLGYPSGCGQVVYANDLFLAIS